MTLTNEWINNIILTGNGKNCISENNSEFAVTKHAVHSGGESDKCFYCGQALGADHAPDCPTIRTLLRLKISGTIVVSIPSSLSKEEKLEYASGLYCDAIQLLSKEWPTKDDEDSFQDYEDETPWECDEGIFLDECIVDY